MNIDPWWSWDVVGGATHDGIVLYENQWWPNAINIELVRHMEPGSHSAETSPMRASLLALVCIFALACTNEGKPPFEPPPTTEAARRLVWRNLQHEGGALPAVDASRAYFGSAANVITAVDKVNGTLAWQLPLPATGQPVTVLVRAGDCLLVPAFDLWCLDPATGSTRWRFSREPDEATRFLPVVADGVIYTGSSHGRLMAISLATGSPLWVQALNANGNVQMPVVRSGLAYVTMVVAPPEGGIVGSVAAVDASTGAELWRTAIPVRDPTITTMTAHPVVAGNVVVASPEDGYLYGFDRVDGSLRWTAPRAALPGTPGTEVQRDLRFLAALEDVVFAGSSIGTVSAYSAADGSHLWTETTHGAGSPLRLVVDSNRVYTVTAGGQLVVFDAITGAVVWKAGPADLGVPSTIFGIAPAFDDSALYVGGSALVKFRKD